MRRMKVRFSRRGINLLPSLCTTAGLFFAFFSIVRSINGDHYVAAWAILFSCFFDMIDGRIARMTNSQSEFGKEYDSLVDLSSFGMAPAVLAYTWTLNQFRTYGWVVAFLYFACAALRLARFNVQHTVVDKQRFNGLATPPAAALIATFVMFHREVLSPFLGEWEKGLVMLAAVPALAVLMVSKIRYRSFKEYDMKRENAFYVLLGAAAFIGIVALNPDVILFLGFLTYALSGPVMGILSLRKLASRRPDAAAGGGEKAKTKRQRFSTVVPMNREEVEEVKEEKKQVHD